MILPEALPPFSPAEIDAHEGVQSYRLGLRVIAGSFVARLQFTANPNR
jgi:hypothetical protein